MMVFLVLEKEQFLYGSLLRFILFDEFSEVSGDFCEALLRCQVFVGAQVSIGHRSRLSTL
jgi:hypothetical protein